MLAAFKQGKAAIATGGPPSSRPQNSPMPPSGPALVASSLPTTSTREAAMGLHSIPTPSSVGSVPSSMTSTSETNGAIVPYACGTSCCSHGFSNNHRPSIDLFDTTVGTIPTSSDSMCLTQVRVTAFFHHLLISLPRKPLVPSSRIIASAWHSCTYPPIWVSKSRARTLTSTHNFKR